MRKFLSLIITISVLFLLPTISHSADQEILIVADGGLYIHPRSSSSPIPGTELTIFIQSSTVLSKIKATIAHPYGDGPFEVRYETPFIRNKRVEWIGDEISFEIELDNADLSSLQRIIAFQPTGNRTLQRGYPHPVTWKEIEISDSSGNVVTPVLKTDPLVTNIDYSDKLTIWIQLEGFDPETVDKIFLTASNDVEFYPPLQFSGDFPLYSASTIYEIGTFNPLTFTVSLTDGTTYTYKRTLGSYNLIDNLLILSPTTHISSWELY